MRRSFRRLVVAVFVTGLVGILASSEHANAQSSACDAYGGAARSQCRTYCDVRHCHVTPHASCDQLRKNFAKQTGTTLFPCDVPATATPQVTATPTATSTPVPSPTATLVATACPGVLELSTGVGELDVGWKGYWHGLPTGGTDVFTVDVIQCENPTPPCGACTFTGPIENVSEGAPATRRCATDPSVQCTSDADCTDEQCVIFAGAPAPYSAGGVSLCTLTQVIAADGAVYVESGATFLTLTTSSEATPGTPDQPCPRCLGDGAANDGSADGTCDGGMRAGLACDASASPAIASFGPTSLDCPPTPSVATSILPAQWALTTDSAVRVLSSDSPNCRAFGNFSECFCDTCNSRPTFPCASNADCPDPAGPIGPTCGGRQCFGGTNDGAACTNSSECPGGACTSPGEPTQPNICTDAVCTETADGHGTCAAGPTIGRCEPSESFRNCVNDGECPVAGDTCVVHNVACYPDNGVVGASIVVTGTRDALGADLAATPTLVGLSCSVPTRSSAVNVVAGLPGLARVILPVAISDPTATP